MARPLLQVVAIVSLLCCALADSKLDYPLGDVRNCPTTQPVNGSAPLLRMEVLPGIGFDNLRNLDMSQVVAYNYSLCKTTNDGKYLIPNDVQVVPHMSSDVEVYANLIKHWDNYTSLLSSSINIGASVFSLVSGKFSFEYQDVKNHQVNDKTQTTRVQIRHNLYKVSLQPDSQLHPKFKNRLLDIAADLQSNKTDSARYLAELLVRDYGTHILTRMDAGAILAQIDSISDNYVAQAESTSTDIGASASANFLGKFSLSASFNFGRGTVDSDFYAGNRSHSRVLTHGGPPFKPNMTLEEWEKGVPDALVAIDRMGDPLHYLITTDSLPELPEPTLWELVDYVYGSVVRYYQLNTHYGCTDRNSPNFRYIANIDDGSCKAPHTDYRFGGVYQTCQVDPNNNYQNLCTKGAAQVNPLTGDYTCPEGYEAVELHSGTVTGISKKEVCDNICHHCGLFGWSRCCQCISAWVNVLSAASYQAYWCVATGSVSNDTGFMFGGVYTTKTINPVTKSMSCPPHFYPLHIGESMEVCVSDEYDLAYGFSVPFAGFFSCQAGNLLASVGNGTSKVNTKRCPKNYVRFLATVDEGCEINYCANLQSDYQAKPPLLPPFRSKPGMQKNVTQSLVIQGPYGQVWVRDDTGNWIKAAGPVMNGQELLQHLTSSVNNSADPSSESSVSAGAAAAISVVLTLVLCTIVMAAVFGAYKVWTKKRNKRITEDNYLVINGENEVDNPSLQSSFIQEEPDHSGEVEA